MEENDIDKRNWNENRVTSSKQERGNIMSAHSSRDFSATTNKSHTGMIAAASRPVTQQGLTGIRAIPSSSGLNRQYHDKRYYISTIQNHMLLINEELNELKKKLHDNKLDATNYDKCKRQVEDYSKQLSDLEENLIVYNTAIENTMYKSSRTDIDTDADKVRRTNQQMIAQLESLFSEKLTRDEQLSKLQQQIDLETQMTNDILSTFPEGKQQQYQNLWQENERYKAREEQIKNEVKELKNSIRMHEQHIALNELKRTRYNLLLKLYGLNVKRDKLENESKIKRSPSQEREYLLEQVKQDRSSIELFKTQQKDLKSEIEKANERVNELEEELSEKNSSRLNKYRELLKREEAMENFLRTYHDVYEEQLKKYDELNSSIVFSLEYMSDKSIDINFELINTYTAVLDPNASKESLEQEYNKLKAHLAMLNSFSKRFQNEIDVLKRQNIELQTESDMFNNIDRARDDLIERQNALDAQRHSLRGALQVTRAAVAEAEKQKNYLETQLKFNDAYNTLNNLEEKFTKLTDENKESKSTIENVKLMDNFEKLRIESMVIVDSILAEIHNKHIEKK